MLRASVVRSGPLKCYKGLYVVLRNWIEVVLVAYKVRWDTSPVLSLHTLLYFLNKSYIQWVVGLMVRCICPVSLGAHKDIPSGAGMWEYAILLNERERDSQVPYQGRAIETNPTAIPTHEIFHTQLESPQTYTASCWPTNQSLHQLEPWAKKAAAPPGCLSSLYLNNKAHSQGAGGKSQMRSQQGNIF